MSSPVHRYLFSPPGSPTLQASSSAASPSLDALNAVRDFLIPSPRSRDYHSLLPSPKQREFRQQQRQNAEIAPGGFSSTKAYPSRLAQASQPTIIVVRPEENAVASSSTSISANRTTHRRISSTPINVCTDTPLTSQSYSLPIPKPIRRAFVLVTFLVSAYLLLTSLALPAVATTSGADRPSVVPHAESLPTAIILKELQQYELEGPQRRFPPQGRRARGGAPATVDYTRARRAAAPNPRTQRKPVPLSPQYELLALQAYLLSSPTNNLPASVDPTSPLDAGALLGHHIDEAAVEELRREVEPVVVWTGIETWNEPIERILALYQLNPAPQFIRMETRGDVEQLQSVVSRLVPTRPGTPALPMVVIGGQSIAGYEALLELHQEDKLADVLNAAGAVVDGAKVKEDAAALEAKRLREIKQAVMDRD